MILIPLAFQKKFIDLKERISKMQDLLKYSLKVEELEREITDFHLDIATKINKEIDYDLIGFHGHTIYHNSDEKISKQIGLGDHLSKKPKRLSFMILDKMI